MYRIGEFSKMVKLTVGTLRFYEESGLLMPSQTDKFTGYRYYEMTQLYPAQQIIGLRQAGFSIEEIKCILSGKDVFEILEKKEYELKAEKMAAEERLTRLSVIKKFYLEEQTMNYQAVIKVLPECTVYYKRFTVHNFSEYNTIIPQIGAEISLANPDLKCAKPELSYIEYLDGEFKECDVNVEFAEAVEKAGKEVNGIRFKTLQPMKIVSVMHKGGYDGLRKGYAFALNWLKENGHELCGNIREQYIDGCWNQKCEDEYLTEIQFPIE